MARLKCPTCGGVYDRFDARGARYFHVCPPLSSVELVAALETGAVVLGKVDARRLAAAEDADRNTPPPADGASFRSIALSLMCVLRPGHRDENDPDTPAPLELAGDDSDDPTTRPAA